MTVDKGLRGLAQRYYVKALEPTSAAGEHLIFLPGNEPGIDLQVRQFKTTLSP